MVRMRYKYGCDMRGMFSFQILWLLSKRKMSGEEIAREIAKRRGEKPKAGTLYPALKELRMANMVNGVRSGRTITYSLTAHGRICLRHALTYFCRSFGDVFNDAK